MKHPIFHVGEKCNAVIPTSSGVQLMKADITGPLARRSIRNLDGKHIGYAECYRVLLDGATLETLFAERDLRKRWERGSWSDPSCVWKPAQLGQRVRRPQEWKHFK